ncbi:MAG TPA: response regulator transcription factor [Gemmatimonadota bacterium]|jgi:DNA-binding NarL/FixJ family response regulator|nr:response regulator transcription factor [Gemmatimonadota bacterium]
MAERDQKKRLPIGLIARKGPLSSHIRKVLKGSDMALAFDLLPEDVEGDASLGGASVIIVVGPPEARNGSLLRTVRSRVPAARIVVCSEPVESPTIRWAIELGVDGLIWSDRVEDCLELTLRAVHADQVVVPRDILQRIRTRELTNREKQALSMVIMGLTNLEIAQKLFISENTVKSHLNTAYKKLGVHSRAEAQRLIADPDQGLGTGILAITAPGLSRGRPPKKG